MTRRRAVLTATFVIVAGLAGVFTVIGWDQVNKAATVLSSLAAVASVGVAVWAALPGTRGAAHRVFHTGSVAAAGRGMANTGLRALASSDLRETSVEHTGDAAASGEGEANSGIQLT
jgi:cytosine/uracil/thiamine/allantoin permease